MIAKKIAQRLSWEEQLEKDQNQVKPYQRRKQQTDEKADLRSQFEAWLKKHSAPVVSIRYLRGNFRAFLYGRLPELKEPLSSWINILEWSPGYGKVLLRGARNLNEHDQILGELPFE